MPRQLPLYVHKEKSRHGKIVFYFRVGKEERIRLPDDPGSKNFKAAYTAALRGQKLEQDRSLAIPRSLRWLVKQYMESETWAALSVATRKQRGLFYQKVVELSGDIDCRLIRTKDIHKAVERRKATPALANNFLKALRALFKWAVEQDYVEDNPTAGVSKLTNQSDGFLVWTTDEIAKFINHWSIGSRERLAFELILASGLRRSDIVRVGKQHLTNETLRIKTRKTNTPVTVDFSDRLLKLIEVSETGDLALIVGKNGLPMTKESFGNWFGDACREAGVQKSAHGLRKFSATMAANAGATAHQLMAMFGWTTIEQAEIYTKKADRERLGRLSSRLVAEHFETEIAPHLDVGAGKNQKIKTKSKG
ncbi:tyrosine-type recombinase/integrase [Rhizobium leguminosarum]|uniref:tyrosine-type recombinase/integrase n=1 Tax=Rhizobium leguminosarum TaxID=384 RepID=UPI001C963609|nr:tyrosine-type recombinase/integrase [Rhizobium leguminosarum]MBY5601736.1 tyrosine-type recombinase/integrase [Rhizobium leguminosarum]